METSEALIFAPFSCSFVIKTVYAGCPASQVIISRDEKRMENNRRANLLTVGRRKDVAERFHRPDLAGDLRKIQRHRAVLGGLATQFSYAFFFLRSWSFYTIMSTRKVTATDSLPGKVFRAPSAIFGLFSFAQFLSVWGIACLQRWSLNHGC